MMHGKHIRIARKQFEANVLREKYGTLVVIKIVENENKSRVSII